MDVVVMGARPAGLAVAASLVSRGRRPILFEREETPCRAWCRHKDRLALHTDKARSSLPGLPFESALPRYVPRVAFVIHLGAYA